MKWMLLLLCFLIGGCASSQPEPTNASVTETSETTYPTESATASEPTIPQTEPINPIKEMIGDMSLNERVGQLFLARCDASVALDDIETYHLGGFVLFGTDFQGETPNSMSQKINTYQSAAKYPLLIAVDEEGGTVNRVSQQTAFRSNPFPSVRNSWAQGGIDQVLAVEEEKCLLLTSIGININLGPVCDITTDPAAFMYSRSLGEDAQTTGSFVDSTVRLMGAYQLGSVLKHFPGYGNNTDTHIGIAVDNRSLEELEAIDLIPFWSGFAAGADAVMVSHTIVPALDSELPASLSPAIHQYLREEMGFEGVIITDDLVMQAITDQYGAGEAAVMAVLAGNDLLCSTDYRTQYEAVYAAVLDGRIDIDTLNNAVRNVLEWKTELGLI